MFENLKTKVVDIAQSPDTKLFVKTFASYSASVVMTGITIGVIGGVAAIVQNAVIKSAQK